VGVAAENDEYRGGRIITSLACAAGNREISTGGHHYLYILSSSVLISSPQSLEAYYSQTSTLHPLLPPNFKPYFPTNLLGSLVVTT